ncbi:hypothetical protein DSECCO2_350450 [anaerobic digester metagenome]
MLMPDPSWAWFAPAVLVPPALYLVLKRGVTERWQHVVPVLLAVACSLALYAVSPTMREGVGFLLLAVTASLATLVALPAFSYALDRVPRAAAVLVATAVSLVLLFLLVPTPLTGLGTLISGIAGTEDPASWPIAALALFLFALLTSGIGLAFMIFVDEIADRMSSIVSGLFFGILLLLASLAVSEAVLGGLLALALLQFIRFVPEKGIHMLLLFPITAGVLAVTAFTESNPALIGSESLVLPLLVPALALIAPFVLLEPQVLTRREGVGIVACSLLALPAVSLLQGRQPGIASLNAFVPAYGEHLAFEPALLHWGVLYVEVLLFALAFYLLVMMGLSAYRRPTRDP